MWSLPAACCSWMWIPRARRMRSQWRRWSAGQQHALPPPAFCPASPSSPSTECRLTRQSEWTACRGQAGYRTVHHQQSMARQIMVCADHSQAVPCQVTQMQQFIVKWFLFKSHKCNSSLLDDSFSNHTNAVIFLWHLYNNSLGMFLCAVYLSHSSCAGFNKSYFIFHLLNLMSKCFLVL